MTAFVISNNLGSHRLGITASRKVARHAVDRNRVKRLLREAFRLSVEDLSALQSSYDWVLNARRSLLKVKVDAVIDELRKIIAQVSLDGQAPARPPAAIE
jgi:ribonuclease P protein component